MLINNKEEIINEIKKEEKTKNHFIINYFLG